MALNVVERGVGRAGAAHPRPRRRCRGDGAGGAGAGRRGARDRLRPPRLRLQRRSGALSRHDGRGAGAGRRRAAGRARRRRRRSSAATASARSSRSTSPSATARSCGRPCSPTRRCSCSCPRRPSASRPSTPSSRRRCARAGREAGVEAWLGGRADGAALERARAAHRGLLRRLRGPGELAGHPPRAARPGRARRRAHRAVDRRRTSWPRPTRWPRCCRPRGAPTTATSWPPRAPCSRHPERARGALQASVKACRLPVALLAALLALLARPRLRGAGAQRARAPPSSRRGPPIELPVQVAPGLTVRVRDPYGGLIARNRLFVAFSVRYAQPRRSRARRLGDVDARRRRPAPRRGRARSAAGAVDDVRGRPARRRRAHRSRWAAAAPSRPSFR